jgi:hypothetical protein
VLLSAHAHALMQVGATRHVVCRDVEPLAVECCSEVPSPGPLLVDIPFIAVGRSISPKHQQSHRDGVVALVTRIIPLVTAFASRTGCARTEMRNRLQVNSRGQCLAKYNYRDIDAICLVSDYPGGFVVMLVI